MRPFYWVNPNVTQEQADRDMAEALLEAEKFGNVDVGSPAVSGMRTGQRKSAIVERFMVSRGYRKVYR